MNWYFVAAAATATVVSLVHTVMGERLIFTRLRWAGVVPTNGGNVLEAWHVRILWATWHVLTVFGLCMATVLLKLSYPEANIASAGFIAQACAIAALAGSAVVAIGTKARHPGWVGLLAVTVLVWLGLSVSV